MWHTPASTVDGPPSTAPELELELEELAEPEVDPPELVLVPEVPDVPEEPDVEPLVLDAPDDPDELDADPDVLLDELAASPAEAPEDPSPPSESPSPLVT